MADYDLKYTGEQIDALLDTANELQANGYIYKGVATPSTNPGTTTQKCAYIAAESGTYTYFGSLIITGLSVLTYNGSTWAATALDITIDVEQTTGTSTTAVMSQKAVTDALNDLVSQLSPIEKKIEEAEAEYYEPITVTYVQGSTKNADGTIDSTSTKNITTQFLDLTGVSEIVFCVDNPPTGLSNLYLKPTWYNSSKGFVSVGSWTSNKTITIPNNVSFLRISLSVYVNGSQINLTPSVAQTYGFRVEPYQMDRWYGLLGKTEALKTDLDAAEEDIDLIEKEIYSEEPEEKIIDGSTLVSCGGTINISTNKWVASTEYYGSLINCVNFRGMTCILTKDTSLSTNMGYAFVTSGFSNGNTPNYATGYSRVLYTSSDVRTVVPNDAVYLFVQLRSTIYSLAPKTIQLGLRGLKERVEDLEEIVDSIGSSSGFRIASYNIGHFSHGAYTDSTITSSDYDTKLAAYRQLIYGKIDADVIGLCEYSAIFGNNGTTNTSAKDVLFNRYEFDYIGEQIRYSCNAVYSNLFVENLSKKTFDCNQDAVITHTNLAQATDFYYIEGDLWFNGVMIKLVMTHLAFDNNNPQVALNQINELITKFDSYNRVIMMGDWNTGISGQSAFVTAGYTLGNDGSFLTYSDTVAQYALDNIIVKGVNISNFGMIHTTGLSDHLPVYATIMV